MMTDRETFIKTLNDIINVAAAIDFYVHDSSEVYNLKKELIKLYDKLEKELEDIEKAKV